MFDERSSVSDNLPRPLAAVKFQICVSSPDFAWTLCSEAEAGATRNAQSGATIISHDRTTRDTLFKFSSQPAEIHPSEYQLYTVAIL